MSNVEAENWSFLVPKREFVLVSAPMRGVPGLNLPEIRRVCHALRSTGIEAFNPFENETPVKLLGQEDSYFHTQYLPLVTHKRCVGVCVLPGWMHSDGALTEVVMATMMGKPQFVFRVLVDGDGHMHPHLQELKREGITI